MAQAAGLKEPLNVMISGAAGQIGYSLIPLFASGLVFGSDQPMNLILLDIERMMKPLQGVVMEIQDGSYPLVNSITPTFEHEIGFKDLDYAILVGGMPRRKGQTRGDLLVANIKIFESAGKSLAKYSKSTCKTLVIANPANSNCWVCAHYACEANKDFKKTNFAALTRLDQNRSIGQLALNQKCFAREIEGVSVWGNHSASMVPDIRNATAKGNKVNLDNETLANFEKTVQLRGKSVIEARGASSAMSAANAIKDCIRNWHCGSNGKNVAMGIYTGAATKSSRNSKNSDGAETEALKNLLSKANDDKKEADPKEVESKKCSAYAEPLVSNCEVYNLIADIAPDVFFSCPVVCQNGEYKPSAVNGDHNDKAFVAKIANTGVELVNEKAAGLAALKK